MPRNSRALIAAAVLLGLAGCGETRRPEVPQIVTVTVDRYVPLDQALTAPCPAQHASDRTVGAVLGAYNANIPAHEDCDARMARIRTLQPEVTP